MDAIMSTSCFDNAQELSSLADKLISQCSELERGSTVTELNRVRTAIPLLFTILNSSDSQTRDLNKLSAVVERLHAKYLEAAQAYEKLYADFLLNKDRICKALTAVGRGN
jgi:hypothetical protein